MHSRQPLSGLRVIKRRLRVIQRPAVWGTTLIIAATVIIFMDYWRGYSQSNLARQNAPADSINLDDPNLLLSDEDRAIAADIDTVPLLLNDFQGPEPENSPEPEAPAAASPSIASSPLPSVLPGFPQQVEPVDKSGLQSPFNLPRVGGQAPGGIGAGPLIQRSPSSASVMPSLGQPSVLPAGSSVLPAPVVSTPLQEALVRHQQPIPLEHTQGLPAGTVLPAMPAMTSIPSEVEAGLPDMNPGLYRAPTRTSPPLGTTGYVLPSSLRINTPAQQAESLPLAVPEGDVVQPLPPNPNSVPSIIRP